MHDQPSFGRWLKERRQALGLTQSNLAEQVGCATITIKRIEMETMRPSQQMVAAILKHLEVPASQVDELVRLARSRRPASPAPDPATDETAPTDPAQVATRNPYKGLRAFGATDAADFFGRTALIERLLARLAPLEPAQAEPTAMAVPPPHHFLAVVGPSGSGKSSVVRAGVVPALRDGLLPGSPDWRVAELLPGANPFEELEAALLRVADNPPSSLRDQLQEDERGLLRAIKRILPADPACELVLVIDQFEELFTLVWDEPTRQRFIASLITAVTDPRSCLRLIITLRADFYDRPLRYEALGNLMHQATEVVLPMTADELEQAIVGPAARVGLELERDLVLTIIRDVRSQPGALPLMQYALTELFERRNGATLTRQVYEASGGVTGALARRADDLYTNLAPSHQQAARQLFLRLITPGDGVPDTRRRMRMAELGITAIDELLANPTPDPGQVPPTLPLAQVIELFSRYRLLTLDYDPLDRSPTVEIAHEALIATWQRLQLWVDENRAGLRIHRTLTEAAREWQRLEHDEGTLYRGIRLAQAHEWVQDYRPDLNTLEQQFLQASEEAAEAATRQQEAIRERELAQARALADEQQRRIDEQTSASQSLRRRALFLAATMALALIAALTAGVLGVQAQQRGSEAQGLALTAASQAALAQGDIDQALALGLAAVRADIPAAQAEVTLSQAAYTPGTRHLLLGHADEVWGVDFSPDGRQAVSSSEDSTIRLWDVATGTELRTLDGHTDGVDRVVWSHDGRYLLSGALDGTVRLWDAASGAELRVFVGHTDGVRSVAFSPDDQYAVSVSDDTTVRLWDVATGRELRQFTGHTARTGAVVFSPDGATIFSGSFDRTIRAWDVASGREVATIETDDRGRIFSMAISPDGTYLLIGTSNIKVWLWEIASRTFVREFSGHTEAAIDVAFSHDGSLALVGTYDNQLRLWDVASGRELHRFEGHTREVLAVAFSPDDRLVLSGARNGTIRLWDVTNGAERHRYLNDTPIGNVNIGGTDGALLAVTAIDSIGQLRDSATGEVQRELHGHTDMLLDLVVSRDQQRALSSSHDTTVRLWDVASGAEVRRFDFDQIPWQVALSPDGQAGAAGLYDGTIQLWYLDGDRQGQRLVGHAETVTGMRFSPDGQTLLSSSWDGTVRLWDVATGANLQTFDGHTAGVNAVDFSPDGRRVVSGSTDTTLRLWDARSGAEIRRFAGHTSLVWGAAFSPDGRLIASGGQDGTVRLWETATGRELRRYTGHQGPLQSVVFSADGATIISGAIDATLRVWRIDTLLELVAWTCANRYVPALTPEQRQLYAIGPEPLCPAPQGSRGQAALPE